jgi:hypothetical protein
LEADHSVGSAAAWLAERLAICCSESLVCRENHIPSSATDGAVASEIKFAHTDDEVRQVGRHYRAPLISGALIGNSV